MPTTRGIDQVCFSGLRRSAWALLALAAIATSAAHADTSAAIAAFDRKDYNTAWREFLAAAQKGDAEAEAGVGAMLFNKINPPGTGFYYECEKWLVASAEQRNAKGMTFLGLFYFADGRRLSGGGNSPGMSHAPAPAALSPMAEKRFREARELFERASAKGDGYAMGNLAVMLDAGVGGPRDPARAAQLRAGLAGHSDRAFAQKANKDPATFAMNASWQSGHIADALRAAQASAAKGDASGEALLGRAYYEGVGVPVSYPTALSWLNRAVAQNNADALFFLGLMYEHAHGVPQNFPHALELFDRAAALGQGYARMEAKGMRMQGESNRIAAMLHGSGTEDTACSTAGGISSPGGCLRGGDRIDPWSQSAWATESSSAATSGPSE